MSVSGLLYRILVSLLNLMRSNYFSFLILLDSGGVMAWLAGTFDGKEEVIGDAVPRLRTTIELSKSQRVISGDVFIDSWFFGAKEILFKKGARLIFSANALTKRSELFIAAQTIIIEDGVGTITCQVLSPSDQVDRGQAASGAPGLGEGAHGSAGAGGLDGVAGIDGQNAPNITLFVSTLAGNGNLEINVKGGSGGNGGRGQKGGDGGTGSRGSSARQASQDILFGGKAWLPYCASGPGTGGTGGAGGAGGPGGVGGIGGNGGTVTLCADPNNHQILTQAINVVVEGGAGGKGGEGGLGGGGGAGGAEGQLANFFNSAGRNGSPGASGGDGLSGNTGNSGHSGAMFVIALDPNLSNKWFGF
ncbi:hypothetical protein [Citrobacter portucalensis]|uniref:hypothetical protein n=1 Tax=Citrobacter portucalensis TaxID=1639133 RepID=UPI00351DA868